jgi:hypothetical protein
MSYRSEKLFGAAVVVVGGIGITAGSILGLAALWAYPTKWVVNYLFTPNTIFSLFGVSQLTLWKAMALNFISETLFKGSSSITKKKKEKKEEKKEIPGQGRYVS